MKKVKKNIGFFYFCETMKKTCLILIVWLCTMNGLAQHGAQFENQGFENWNDLGKENCFNEPIHWHSGMSATGTYSGFLSQQIEPSNIVRPGTAGTKSIRLYPKSILGVTANGNLTNGRVNAGSMLPAGKNNYNYTQRSDSRFNTPITSVPDSLVVWVCFRSSSPDQRAMIQAVVHGDADFKLIANGTVSPADQRVATAALSIKRTSKAGGDYTWCRVSIPFVKDGPCNDPRYILFTITTNERPGYGNTADDLLVDDVLLIWNE